MIKLNQLKWKIAAASCALVLGLALASTAQAAVIGEFTLTLEGPITGGAPGTVTGTGVAQLDDLGALYMQNTTNAVTFFTNTTTTGNTNLFGVLTGSTMAVTGGEGNVDTCVNNGGIVDGCGSINGGVFPEPITPFDLNLVTLPALIMFDLNPGGVTTFQTINASNPAASVTTNYTLTTIPEPGTALLFALGLTGLSAQRRRA